MLLPENGRSTSSARASVPKRERWAAGLGTPPCSPLCLHWPSDIPFLPPSTAETGSTYAAKMHTLSRCLHRETRVPAEWQARLKTVPGQRNQRKVRPVSSGLFSRMPSHVCFRSLRGGRHRVLRTPSLGPRAGEPALLLPLAPFGQRCGTAQLSQFTPDDFTASSSAELTCNFGGLLTPLCRPLSG